MKSRENTKQKLQSVYYFTTIHIIQFIILYLEIEQYVSYYGLHMSFLHKRFKYLNI